MVRSLMLLHLLHFELIGFFKLVWLGNWFLVAFNADKALGISKISQVQRAVCGNKNSVTAFFFLLWIDWLFKLYNSL